jgi:predicted ATP-grasp superfamily ATP-dependent carboligase
MPLDDAARSRLQSAAVPPAAIIIDGAQQALSVARSLGRQGIDVYALTGAGEGIRFSRYARWLRMPDGGTPSSWSRFLLGSESDRLAGSVLLACSDLAIDLVARNTTQLSRKFLVEESDPTTRLCLIDKHCTYEKAVQAGLPIVRYERVSTSSRLNEMADRFRFPVVLKPVYSPDADFLGRKFVMARDKQELLERTNELLSIGAKMIVMEFVPGGDELLCSYYTYMDENGTPLVEFTKRLLRRSPMHTGIGCYHISDWNEEAVELGRRFFKHVGLKGIGNIEFKRDRRDGKLKIIDVNARFTAGDPLLTRSGIDLATITYRRLTRKPLPPLGDYRKGVVYWLPAEDARAFFQLRSLGKITFLEWFKGILRARQLPYFSWRDPVPSLYVNTRRAVQLLQMLRPRLRYRGLALSRGTRQ